MLVKPVFHGVLGQARSALCLKNSCADIFHGAERKALQRCCKGHSLAVKIKRYRIGSRLFTLKIHLCNACKLRLCDFRLTFKQLLKGNCRRKCLLPKDFSMMPYTLSEMNDKLIEAYDVLSHRYDAVRSFYSKVKPVALSEGMSYTHITGVYTFFTGESNLNVNFPDYTLPYTAAHELAHQRGFAREDEANLIAFLACDASSDPYIRYSGYVGMYQYVMSALYRASKDLYREVYLMGEESLRREQTAYAEFFKKYEKSKVGEVSGAINNSYLQSQGTVGTKSYGMVVDLVVAYFRKQGAE